MSLSDYIFVLKHPLVPDVNVEHGGVLLVPLDAVGGAVAVGRAAATLLGPVDHHDGGSESCFDNGFIKSN